ncbi:MAG: polysaccharide deacetylase [Clostridiaceae bacterium]|nr:polysaccharide deacetylase [Clostridiaceae bacterium]
MKKIKNNIWFIGLVYVFIWVINVDAIIPSIITEAGATPIEEGASYDQGKDDKENGIIHPDNVKDSTEESPDLEVSSSGTISQETLNSIYKRNGEKVAYLTFDDGPTPKVTPQILDILKREEIKATFFPIGQNVKKYSDITKRIYEEGHDIGNHTYSHIYREIYSSPESLVSSLKKSDEILESVLGKTYDFNVMRFPGGSFGDKLEPFRRAVNETGYSYIDWNCINGDAEVMSAPADRLIETLKKTSQGKEKLVILMHDSATKATTVEALPEIIQYLKDNGYTFKLLSQIEDSY